MHSVALTFRFFLSFFFSLSLFASSVKCSQKTCALLKNCHVGTEMSRPPIFGGRWRLCGKRDVYQNIGADRNRMESNGKKQFVRKKSYLGDVRLRRGRQRRVACPPWRPSGERGSNQWHAVRSSRLTACDIDRKHVPLRHLQ